MNKEFISLLGLNNFKTHAESKTFSVSSWTKCTSLNKDTGIIVSKASSLINVIHGDPNTKDLFFIL